MFGDPTKHGRWEQQIKEWMQLSVFPKLTGEGHPYNVYLIEWEDGAGYVGMTSLSIMDQVARDVGQIHSVIAHYALLPRRQAGVGYRFRCLHTNLDQPTAEALKAQEINDRRQIVHLFKSSQITHNEARQYMRRATTNRREQQRIESEE